MPNQQMTEAEAFVEERRTANKNKIDLIKMVRSILRIPKHKLVKCPECGGSGLDTAHKWPDGSFASCEQCEGQGTIKE